MNEQVLQTLRKEREQIISDLRSIEEEHGGIVTAGQVDTLNARLAMLNQLLANYPAGKA
jgi:hypothetical protein